MTRKTPKQTKTNSKSRPAPGAAPAPSSAEVERWLARAERAERAGKRERAEAILRQGIARYPAAGDLHMTLGILRDERGDAAGAEVAFREAIACSSGDPFIVSNAASFLLSQGRPDEAADACRSALPTVRARVDPHDAGDPERWLLGALELKLGESLIVLGQRAEGLALLEPWRDHPDHGPEVAAIVAHYPDA